MPIVSTNPVQVQAPDVAYGKLAVELQIIPIWRDSEVSATVVFRGMHYRVLPSGAIERAPGNPNQQVYGDVFAEAQTDPDLAAALIAINTAIQAFVTAKGL